jgi:nucleoside 2-deoxyribosyltransferase
MHASAAPPRCYVASALGFTHAGAHYYEHVYLPALRTVVTTVDPWSLATAQEAAEARAGRREREFALDIGRRNADAIRSCTLLAAHLDGQELDAGTASEVGFAAALGLRCFGLRSDLRENGEPGMSVNLQVEHFVVASGGSLCTSLDGLVEELAAAAR